MALTTPREAGTITAPHGNLGDKMKYPVMYCVHQRLALENKRTIIGRAFSHVSSMHRLRMARIVNTLHPKNF